MDSPFRDSVTVVFHLVVPGFAGLCGPVEPKTTKRPRAVLLLLGVALMPETGTAGQLSGHLPPPRGASDSRRLLRKAFTLPRTATAEVRGQCSRAGAGASAPGPLPDGPRARPGTTLSLGGPGHGAVSRAEDGPGQPGRRLLSIITGDHCWLHSVPGSPAAMADRKRLFRASWWVPCPGGT